MICWSSIVFVIIQCNMSLLTQRIAPKSIKVIKLAEKKMIFIIFIHLYILLYNKHSDQRFCCATVYISVRARDKRSQGRVPHSWTNERKKEGKNKGNQRRGGDDVVVAWRQTKCRCTLCVWASWKWINCYCFVNFRFSFSNDLICCRHW